eukprot:2941932-Pleurochrysis_carterae.AAC.1
MHVRTQVRESERSHARMRARVSRSAARAADLESFDECILAKQPRQLRESELLLQFKGIRKTSKRHTVRFRYGRLAGR